MFKIETIKISRKSRFKSLLLDKNFEPENQKDLEEFGDNNCQMAHRSSRSERFLFLW